jgi:hypothetical protein
MGPAAACVGMGPAATARVGMGPAAATARMGMGASSLVSDKTGQRATRRGGEKSTRLPLGFSKS